MAVTWSVGLRNAVLNAIETEIGEEPRVRIYDGSPPANVGAALSGNNVLVEFPLVANWMDDASGGSKTFTGLPLQQGATRTGIATFYRIYKADGVTASEQGTVGVTSAHDMQIDNTNIAEGQQVRITGWTKNAPHA
ncbi:MAG: hypothetical protein WDA07_06460 [Leucobacter sp.]